MFGKQPTLLLCSGSDDGDDQAGPSGNGASNSAAVKGGIAVPLPSVCHGGRLDPPDFQAPMCDLTPPNLQPHDANRALEPMNTMQNNQMAHMLGFGMEEAGVRDHARIDVRYHLAARCKPHCIARQCTPSLVSAADSKLS